MHVLFTRWKLWKSFIHLQKSKNVINYSLKRLRYDRQSNRGLKTDVLGSIVVDYVTLFCVGAVIKLFQSGSGREGTNHAVKYREVLHSYTQQNTTLFLRYSLHWTWNMIQSNTVIRVETKFVASPLSIQQNEITEQCTDC